MTIKNKIENNHYLASSIVYGPVPSRRFGHTLGLNILPASKKYCNFNCVYCQLGWTDLFYQPESKDLPSFDQVKTAIDEIDFHDLEKRYKVKISHVIISGNGEPTLHPDFFDIVRYLLSFRDKNKPELKLACLTNGTTLASDKIRETLILLDECHVKLDANYKKVDLPQGDYHIDDLIGYLSQMKNLVIQSCFLKGRVSNLQPEVVQAWVEKIKKISPKRVDLYTLSRKTAASGLEPLTTDEMRTIQKMLKENQVEHVKLA